MDSFACAREAALDALGGDAASRVTAYYQEGGDYAGALFLSPHHDGPPKDYGH